jgi:hypothetical protein
MPDSGTSLGAGRSTACAFAWMRQLEVRAERSRVAAPCRRMRQRAIVWADDYSIVDTQRSAAARRGAERSTDGCQVAGMFLRATATAGVALAEVLLRTDIDPRTPFMHDA